MVNYAELDATATSEVDDRVRSLITMAITQLESSPFCGKSLPRAKLVLALLDHQPLDGISTDPALQIQAAQYLQSTRDRVAKAYSAQGKGYSTSTDALITR